MLRNRLLPVLLMIVGIAPSCAARNPGDPLRPGFNLFSKEQDVELGREAAAQVRQQVDVVQNRDLQNYIARVGQRLAQQQGADQYPYSFTLVNDPAINAFALPGGPTFIHTGLVKAADNEAQLAGVMAHEIAHVALRHGTNQVSKANLIQLPAMIASGVAGGGIWGQLAQLGIGLGANSILLKYSRDAERQADALGARLMAQAGYNPLEMARFFEKLAAEGGSRGPQFLSSHPDPGDRMQLVEAEIRTLPKQQFGYSTGQFDTTKRALGGLPAPSRQNADRVAPPASTPQPGGLRELRTERFAISHPSNWQVFGDQNAGALTIAPREGIVQDNQGNTQIGHGVMANWYFSQTRGLQEATRELLGRLQSSNPTMQVSGRQSRVRVSGSEGLMTMMQSTSPYGGAEIDYLLTVNRPEGLFYLVFVAPERDFGALRSTFDEMIRSIRFP